MPALKFTPKEPINLGEGTSKDSKKLVTKIQRTQLVAMQLANENNKMLKQILTSLVALSTPITSSNPSKGKMSMVEEKEEARKDVFVTAVADPQSIIPGTNMPLSLADALAQRLQDEENEAMRREEVERKLEVYQSKAIAKRALQKKISRKESESSKKNMAK
ncbi:hypothetical protein L1987_33306 [Smallanthus sonchifolius]|uniref:Uncharacterized protein n=1 Tax=Smallanthus sonchifolius TaxID=185202 RepID=A0ACB9HS10_9ASTR|nr:hypothetical protein L1987_33306 [Smallanthus sonchifolius]